MIKATKIKTRQGRLKLKELRYSERTIKTYKPKEYLFERQGGG